MPTFLYVRIVGAVIAVAALLFGWHSLTHHYDKQGYERRAAEDKTAADQQAERNRDLQRQAELKYVVQRAATDHYFVTTVKEVHELAAPLASCPIPDDLRLRINAAIECASADPAPTCGTPGKVPGAGETAGSRSGQ